MKFPVLKRGLILLVLASSFALFPAERAPNGAGPTPQAALFRNTFKVATLNMYVGFDMGPVVGGQFGPEAAQDAGLIDKLVSIYRENRPKDRIRAMAREVVKAAPDVLSLQEATWLSVFGLTLGDYAGDIIREIKNLGGPDYGLLSLDTFSVEGTFGSGIPTPVSFKDREAVLYRKEMRCRSIDDGKIYETARSPAAVLGHDFTLRRGAIGMTCVSPAGKPFYLYTTHLDVNGQGPVQEAQAEELVDYIRSTATDPDKPVIVTGDFNAREDLRPTKTYAILRDAGFEDAYRERYPDASAHPGLTCCQSETLRNGTSVAGGRYDYVFFRGGGLGVKGADVFADQPFSFSDEEGKIWPSDHFGVWAEFEWEGGRS